MKNTTLILIAAAGLSGVTTLNLLAGPPVVVVQPPSVVVQAPPVVVAPPPVAVVPATTVTVETVPDSYVWDGVEFVGVVGSDYFYLGPDHAWLRLDAPRLARFHDWEHDHADWRTHATHNELYRHDARVHQEERHDADHHDRDHDRH